MRSQEITSIDDMEPELMVYLAQRFASVEFASRIIQETRRRLLEADVMALVGDPQVYVCTFAMSVGRQLLHDEYRKACH